jgi:hypothetical protein
MIWRALSHIDPAFQMLCQKGFMIGLAAMSEGLGLAGKTEGMDGLRAVEMWKGTREDQDKVLEYVAQDARATAMMYEAILEKGYVRWITKRGSWSRYPWIPKIIRDEEAFTYRLFTAKESLEIPEPDTSWMDKPLPREKFYGWAEV